MSLFGNVWKCRFWRKVTFRKIPKIIWNDQEISNIKNYPAHSSILIFFLFSMFFRSRASFFRHLDLDLYFSDIWTSALFFRHLDLIFRHLDWSDSNCFPEMLLSDVFESDLDRRGTPYRDQDDHEILRQNTSNFLFPDGFKILEIYSLSRYIDSAHFRLDWATNRKPCFVPTIGYLLFGQLMPRAE